MVVTYIYHSGFLVETNSANFLFDYYKGEIPKLSPEKPLIVFVSHKHQDHYNDEIFDLLKQYPNTRFIFAKGISAKFQTLKYRALGIELEDRITTLPKNTDIEMILENGKFLKITTLRSTDEGVAFLIRYGHKVYYHAGDLNLWVWEGESKQYNENMRKNYLAEMEKMRNMQIDVAFVPLDPRLEHNAFGGLETFLEYTDVKKVFPMHMWNNYGIISDFLNKHPDYGDRVMKIERDGQRFEI